jgi:methionyl-tRNA formyltransferase
MDIVFIGCVESSMRLLQPVLYMEDAEIVGIVTKRSSSFNADFCSLEPIAAERGIPCYVANKNDQTEMAAWIQERNPEVGYCFGWSYLLQSDILSVPELGFVGYHPTKLPRNRGRHPIIWTLALGLKETASTFFFMDERPDSGDILSQQFVPIHQTDDARSLYDRLMTVGRQQVATFTPQLASRDYPRAPQDHAEANYWRKRSRSDGEVDWRMSSTSIYNLVRALASPYPGAHCIVDSDEVKLWASEIVDDEFDDVQHIEPGKVLASDAERIVVKCGEGVIALHEHDFKDLPEPGDYLS